MKTCPRCGNTYTSPPLPDPKTMDFEAVMRHTRALAAGHTPECKAWIFTNAVHGLPPEAAAYGTLILNGAV